VARRLLLDLRPLRESPEFRRLTAGSTVSTLGGQMTRSRWPCRSSG
jgi:hypothetical protein